MDGREKINYLEFPARDMAATKTFFKQTFAWTFEDYGPEYSAFSNAGVDGGFYTADRAAKVSEGSALVVLYSVDLEACREKIRLAGGEIVRDIFTFPGGRRFHFCEPSGNEFAVWSDKGL